MAFRQWQLLQLGHIFDHSHADGTLLANRIDFKVDGAAWADLEVVDFLGLDNNLVLRTRHGDTDARLNLVENVVIVVYQQVWIHVLGVGLILAPKSFLLFELFDHLRVLVLLLT